MSTELKTDSSCRYMLYRKEDYSKGIFFTREEKRAVEAGYKFTMAAYRGWRRCFNEGSRSDINTARRRAAI